MNLETALLTTINEYEALLRSGNANLERIKEIHARMKPLRERIEFDRENPLIVRGYDINHPNGWTIRNEHTYPESRVKNVTDYQMGVRYRWKDDCIDSVLLFAHAFFFPRYIRENKWWETDPNHGAGDYGFNETEYGFMHALRADGTGAFWSNEIRESKDNSVPLIEKQKRRIKLYLWNTSLPDEAIQQVVVSKYSLQKGDLTAFLKHVNCNVFDEI